ncbi:MAG TPA: Ig-like domain-containing protein [Methanomassiliicoccales archaeon]
MIAVVIVAGLVVAGAFMLLPGKTTDTLKQNPGTNAIRSVLSKTTINLGESVTQSATVPGLGNGSAVPAGTVTFQVRIGSGQWTSYDTEMLIANGTDGNANSSAYTPYSVDSYSLRAVYGGDNNYAGSQSAELSLTILTGLYVTTVSDTLSKATINLGESVTNSVTVPGLGQVFPVPSGSVAFQYKVGTGAWTTFDNQSLTASGTDGVATSNPFVPSSMASYYFRALYSGDGSYMAAQSGDSASSLTVNMGSGAINNVLSESTITLGNSVIDSVTVPGPGTNFPAPTGTVTFQVKAGMEEWTTFDTKTLTANGTNGVANSTAYLPMVIGSFSFRVIYSGDSNNLASQTGDGAAILTVIPGHGGPVTMVLSQTSMSLGGSVTASVTVPGIGTNFPLPTGTAEFQVKGSPGIWTTYDTATLSISGSNGVATSAAYAPLYVDSYSFRAVYSGDGNYSHSQSGDDDAILTVNPGSNPVQIASTLDKMVITLGDSVTASVTVHGVGAGSQMATGLIRFEEKAGTGQWTTYDTKMLSTSGSNAVATSVYAPPMAGAHYFRAVYLGDAYYMSGQTADSAEPLTVNQAQGPAPTTTLSKTTAELGESVTDSVTVPSLGVNFPAPSGTVIFQVRVGSGTWTTFHTQTLSASGSNGVATSIAYLPLNLGSYSFRAQYGGDSNYLASQSADGSDQLTVNPGQGSGPMTNSLSHSTIVLSNSVTDTVTVPGLSLSSPIPSGTITFQVRTGSGLWETYDTKTLSVIGYNGSATSAPYIPGYVGTYSFRALYTGDASYLASQTADDAAVLTVSPGQGTGSITDVLSSTTINLGDSITCTATVPSMGGSFPTPTGSVRFQYKSNIGDWTTYDTKVISMSGPNGVATSRAFQPPSGGVYHFRAMYLGDTHYAAAQSDDSATPLTINQLASKTPVLVVPKTAMLFGHNVSNTVTILRQSTSSATFPVPTGTVEFQYRLGTGEWTTYETKNLVPRGPNGTAYANPYVPLKVGTYTFRVLYHGDYNYTAGQSAVSAGLTVVKVNTYTETKLGVTSINLGQSVRDNVTVYGINGSSVMPTGTVTFQVKNGTGPWVVYDANVPLVNRVATSKWYTPMHVAGDFKFQAIYNGDENYNASHSCPWSEPLNVLVSRVTTTIDIGGATTGHLGQAYTVNTTVTGLGGSYPRLTGNVTFQWQLNGVGGWTNITKNVTLVNGAAISGWFTPTETGRYIFRAVYNGDRNYGSNPQAAVALQMYANPSG